MHKTIIKWYDLFLERAKGDYRDVQRLCIDWKRYNGGMDLRDHRRVCYVGDLVRWVVFIVEINVLINSRFPRTHQSEKVSQSVRYLELAESAR